ncbi:RNA repair transcriptional activator RtcR [Sorangium sp. So ce233]|uniref:RNA repair transcriptional activator RtcR n=1 Tax=Sorangium sp. So ce233 TaxID=3133290 RepID=UPI003F5FF368
MTRKPTVILGMLGPTLDTGKTTERWSRWRPSVALCQHEDLLVDRFELLYQRRFEALAETVMKDVRHVSPETEIRGHVVEVDDPWDFEAVYGALHDFAKAYPFAPDREDYLLHITTGTHVAQICLFLLTESRYFPGRLIQTSPPKRDRAELAAGSFTIIDLDLSKYDRIASRFQKEQREGVSFLKSGIETRNAAYNKLIERIEHVAIASRAPILLMGPTGAGKSQLARKIYDLKKGRRQVSGDFVDLNCATIRGDGAMSALFGHERGSFTGALKDRPGLLRKAHEGVLFLDEIGELGADEQAMLLRAIEEKAFLPVGSDREVRSEFQLLAGTNRDLSLEVAAGRFREDLLARINLWTFRLPGLRERVEDIEPNLEYELEASARLLGVRITMSRDARARLLRFATSREAVWPGNFRDFNAAVTRMATLAPGGRIGVEIVEEEIERLSEAWRRGPAAGGARGAAGAVGEGSDGDGEDVVVAALGARRAAALDQFDRAQLAEVLRVLKSARSLSEAGRVLFAASRAKKKSVNDADRLRKYLARFDIDWSALVGEGG